MIGYLLLYKTKFYFRELKNPWKILLTLVLLFTAWLYGRTYGEISNRLSSGELDFLTPEKLYKLTITAVALFTIIRLIFPGYNPMTRMFPKYYPLSKLERYLSSLINDFYKPFFLYMILFILSGSYYVQNFKLSFLLGALLAMISAHLVRRSIQYMIDFTTKVSMRFIHVLALLAIAYYVFIFFSPKSEFLIQFGSIIIILLVIGFMQESAIQIRKETEVETESRLSNISLKLLWNNKKVRLPLLVAFAFKIVILLGNFFLFKIKGIQLFEKQIILWLFASPLIIFTYVFHNVWGFWKDLWLTMELRIGTYKPMTRQIFQLISIPLAIDLLITVPILLIPGKDVGFILLFYFTTSVYLLFQSFLWSLITPRKIGSSFQIRGSVSPWSIIASMVGILLLAAVKDSQWFYFLIPVFLITAGVTYGLSLHIYKDRKYILSNKLLKD